MVEYGLALAGGGTRGAAHVGVLTALEEEGILPERIAGASAGSMVAGLYASGVEIGEMREYVRYLTKHGRSYIDPDVLGIILFLPQILTGEKTSLTGLIKGKRLEKLICELTCRQELQELNKGILIPAVDINSGNTIVFTNLFGNNIPISALRQENAKWERKGMLCEIIMASCSVPGVFRPKRMGNYLLVDGGVTNNLPADLLIAAGEPKVISVDVGEEYQSSGNESIINIVSHSFSIMSRELKDCRSSGEKLLLKPRLPAAAGLLTFDYMEKCMEEGYIYTKKMIPRIRKVLEKG